MEKIYYSWDDISNLIKNNIEPIQKYNPDYIIAIGGGGLIPARLVRNYINKPIYVVTLSLYDDETIGNKVNIIQWINLNLKDKKVLIIDEIDDTRKTMDFCVKELVEKNNANDMCVFVLQNKLKTKLGVLDNVNYHACQNIDDKWVVYPWDL
jgi:hypoxanthine phosphoribosyltransferase